MVFLPEIDLKYGNKNKWVHTPAETGLPGKQNMYFFLFLKDNVAKVVGILKNKCYYFVINILITIRLNYYFKLGTQVSCQLYQNECNF